MNNRISHWVGVVGIAVAMQVCCAPGLRAQSATATPAADNRAAENMPDQQKSLTEVNKALSNLISTI